MKIKDIPRLKEQVMSMLPVTQAEMWKALELSSKEGSGLIRYMLDEKLIKRTRINIGGKRTFLLESANHEKKNSFSVLLSGDKFSPCCGCEEDCVQPNCIRLVEWVISN